MIKKINISKLRPNMYIHDLNSDWIEHPFFHNSFLIKNYPEIEKIIASGIRHVYIDTNRGLDVPAAPSAAEVQQQLEQKMQSLGRKPKQGISEYVPIKEELVQARRICSEASTLVKNILGDCRLGKQVELERITPLVRAVTGSIFRNPNAIISLLRIKQADNYTFQHSVAVSALLISFCRAMNMERSTIELVGIGGLLHDIGKMKVPDHILNKPGKLSDSEFEIMKKHVVYGCDLLEKIPGVSPISISITAEHHERFDGNGYPFALKEDEISLYGQMASVVDVYDALTSQRVYHKGIEPAEALKKLLEWSDYHFNKNIVHEFIRTIGIYPVGTLVRLESGYLAVVIEQHYKRLLHPKVRVVFNSNVNSYTPPWDFDLADISANDRIVSFESPTRWHINPIQYI